MVTPFLHKLGLKIITYRGFSENFFEGTGFQLKFLKLIEFPKNQQKKSDWVRYWGKIWAKLCPML